MSTQADALVKHGLLPMDKERCQEAGLVIGRAFKADPTLNLFFSQIRLAERERRVAALYGDMLLAMLGRAELVYSDHDGRIAGLGVILPPGAYPLPMTVNLVPLVRYVLRHGLYGIPPWVSFLSIREEEHPKEPCCYLDTLAVDPACQRQGHGSRVMRYLLDRADQDHVGVYLETTNGNNVAYYTKFGFEVRGPKVIKGLASWFFWRPPVSQG